MPPKITDIIKAVINVQRPALEIICNITNYWLRGEISRSLHAPRRDVTIYTVKTLLDSSYSFFLWADTHYVDYETLPDPMF